MMPGQDDADAKEKGTGRFGLPNWAALRVFGVAVQQVVRMAEGVGLAVGHATTKPTCDLSRRDAEINTRGASGVADWKYICQKNTSDTYAWNRTLGYRVAAAIANIDQHSADATGAILALRKSRHATEGSHTIVQSGDGIGAVAFYGSNGTSFDAVAFITAFSDGTPGAANDMPGRLVFSVTPDGSAAPGEAMRLSSTKAALFKDSVKSDSATAGVGYATGAGGTVTQSTDKSTGVTINKVCGQITTNNATLNAGAEVNFTVTNSAVAATDVPVVALASGAADPDNYDVHVSAVAAGSFDIVIANTSGSNLGEALVINFAVFKAVAA